MDDIMSYFLDELIADIKEHPGRYEKYSKAKIIEAIAEFYENSGYENLADIEDMSDKERRKWMREYI